ncbi:hypothetical protein TD95_004050 [Thielaviopsis punctulata]|uniref:Uncharacterized protein n=1 Tax=Thielaviopsis punctulata TaxID=72032 RepID=A0A0F4ZFY4_9PEZI|nr:hypothetical protein TD95_004050 [Thielaviopsis punctulata]
MAQGSIKKSTARPGPKANKASKKGASAKCSKPKKMKTSHDKLQRKFAGALVAKTEKLLGERVGHLEMIGKGKKTAPEDRLNAKGGTKKFG